METWFNTIRERRLFYVVIGLVVLILSLLRWITAGTIDLPTVIDNLLAASVISFVALAFYNIMPKEFPDLKFVVQIDPSLANDALVRALGATNWWTATGHYARWVRTEAAPALEQKPNARVTCAVLNPSNPSLCNAYVRYRNQHRLVHHESWDSEKLQAELVGTIFAAAVYTKTASPLRFDVYISDTFSPLRFDISETLGAITTIDPRDPPLVFSKDSAWYQIVKSHIDEALLLSRKLDFDRANLDVTREPNKDQVRQLLKSVGLEKVSDAVIEAALSQWKKRNKKYW